jgi:hypothetical protein
MTPSDVDPLEPGDEGDDELTDRMIAGEGSDPLSKFFADLRASYPAHDVPVGSELAERLAHRPEIDLRDRTRRRATGVRIIAGGFAGVVALSGLAAAHKLPGPVQEVVADIADLVGIELHEDHEVQTTEEDFGEPIGPDTTTPSTVSREIDPLPPTTTSTTVAASTPPATARPSTSLPAALPSPTTRPTVQPPPPPPPPTTAPPPPPTTTTTRCSGDDDDDGCGGDD